MHRISKSHNNCNFLPLFSLPTFFVRLNYNLFPSPATLYQGNISSLVQRYNHQNHLFMKESADLGNLWQREV